MYGLLFRRFTTIYYPSNTSQAFPESFFEQSLDENQSEFIHGRRGVFQFYALIDSETESDSYVKLEIIRNTVERLKGDKISELHTALKQLESWLPKIIAHQRNPNLPRPII